MTRRADGPPSVLPFFLNAELQELGALSTAALGAHWRLTYWVWGQGKYPDDSDDLLARIARLRPVQWRTVRIELLTVWRVEGGVWVHDRLAQSIDDANGKRRKNSGNGKKGGTAKALKNKGEHLANASQSPPVRQDEDAPDLFSHGALGSDLGPDDLWEAVKDRFAPHLRRAWLDQLTLHCLDGGVAFIAAPTAFVADRVGNQMAEDIRRALAALGRPVSSVVVREGVDLDVVGA